MVIDLSPSAKDLHLISPVQSMMLQGSHRLETSVTDNAVKMKDEALPHLNTALHLSHHSLWFLCVCFPVLLLEGWSPAELEPSWYRGRCQIVPDWGHEKLQPQVWKLQSSIAMSMLLLTINSGYSHSQWPTNGFQDGVVIGCIEGEWCWAFPMPWGCGCMESQQAGIHRWVDESCVICKQCFWQAAGGKRAGSMAGGVVSFIFHVAAVSDKIAVGFMSQDPNCHCPRRNTSWDKQQCQQSVCVEFIFLHNPRLPAQGNSWHLTTTSLGLHRPLSWSYTLCNLTLASPSVNLSFVRQFSLAKDTG